MSKPAPNGCRSDRRKRYDCSKPPLGGGWHGVAVTGGESLKFSIILGIAYIGSFFSPSVSFADSSLVRGSLGRSRARGFIDTLTGTRWVPVFANYGDVTGYPGIFLRFPEHLHRIGTGTADKTSATWSAGETAFHTAARK